MNPAYFETRFRVDVIPDAWPAKFVILSAWETTGHSWSKEKNEAADRELAKSLDDRGVGRVRITGYSPVTGHAEPAWAFPMALDEACDLGLQFRQDALYYVEGDQLSVTHCDHRRGLVPAGSFRQRVDGHKTEVRAE